MLMTPKNWIAAFVVVAALGSPPARADGKNEIRAVTFDEDAGTTRVHVRGAQTPTFTVYKLERPSRVVIDVPQARLAEALRGHEGATVFTPSTWAVSTIAAQQLDDGGQIVRVIVTLARPGRYDVKTDGNEVVVMVAARDAAPKTASPEALAKAQAESEQARKAAATAEQARAQAEARAEAAQHAADLAKAAAEQAQRTGQQASAADLDRAKKKEAEAQALALKAKQDAAKAQADAERMKLAADRAQRDAVAETERARKEANAAKQDVVRTRAEAEAVKVAAAKDMARTRAEAEAVKVAAAREVDAATLAKQDAESARREADAARAEAMKIKDAAARTKAETTAARLEAQAAKAEAAAAKADAEQARRDVAQKRMEAETARTEAARTKDDIARSNSLAAQARTEADAAKADAARARMEARAAKAEAEAAKATAAMEKREAEADKQGAITARAEAERMLKDAKLQLTTLDKKSLEVQGREDKARAAHAAAQAREEAARETVAKATREREAAEAAVKVAAAARDQSSQASAERAKLVAEAKTAEDRLARARQAAEEAESRRTAAESAAAGARKDLDQTRVALASVEQQRTAAERAASDAARKRGEAEAAASDAARRRTEAETAATLASKQRSEAEQQRTTAEQARKAAELAAREAQQAKVAADKQRAIAEAAASKAVSSKHDAEAGLDELMARREAAEKAATEVETRSKAEAKAQAELAAANARKASQDELARARIAASKLADDRKRAEDELADRRKAVALQQAESDRLKTAAAAARDAAEREEKRRAQLAAQRIADEQELAQLEAKKAAASKAIAAARVVAPAVTPVVAPPVVAPAPVKSAFVKDITFKGDDAGGQIDIAMAGEGQVTLGEVTSSHVELIIDGAELAAKLERKLDVTRFGSPVRAVSSFRDRRTSNRVRLIAELASPVTPTLDRDGSTVRLRFTGEQVAKRPMRTQSVPSPIVGGFGAASTPIAQQSVSQLPPQGSRTRKVYRGATVDFDFKDAPIHDLLRTIADTGKVNIVVPDGVDAKVTVRLKRVPWDQALEVILASHGLWYRRDGNLFRIAPRKELDSEDEAEAARREAMIKSETPRSEVVALNYASAADLKSKLEPMLSPKGRIEVDERTNALLVNDIAGNRSEIQRLALQLDTQTPQISIEARIVEARSTFLRQLGIQWGGSALAGAAGGNATGLVWPSSIGIAGGASDAQTNARGVSATPSDFAINLPTPVGTGEGGAIGMSLGSVGGNFNINLRLSALEDSGTVRIISAPKITVLNNKEAKISQGVSIPISVVSAAGTQTTFVQADLALTVTPYVSQRDCAIAMNLLVSKNEPDFVNVGARGDPTILRKEAKTSMLVADGETSVLGGIYTRNTGLAYKKVPFFGDLPVLGWFFKNRRENDDRTEILVFITPKITNKALLHCQ